MAIALIQRVERASVILSDGRIRSIGRGILVYVGFERGDEKEILPKLARKILNLRIFEDAVGKMNLSVKDIGGEILLIPNFTLAGSVRKGNRPSFTGAKSPSEAVEFFLELVALLNSEISLERGEFGDHMRITSSNDGPVNLIVKM
ncbi:MAG: D-tyrosyl-tRNA(Tyr) deacylase [Thermotogae bacterium]|nr:D-tyrosyl-tRNA(Tyr) deacylase [Thermotogota bacterium]